MALFQYLVVSSAINSNFSKINTLSEAEIYCVNFFVNNIYNGIALSVDNLISGIYVPNQYVLYIGAKPDINYSSFILIGYGIRVLQISCISGNWTSSVLNNNYV